MSHSPTIDVAAIVQDEEEIIPLMLRACETLLPNLQKVVIVDGGSRDETAQLARSFGVRFLSIAGGRAKQLNAGAKEASGDVLLFLHGDTCLPERFDQHVLELLANPGTVAGAFALGIDGSELGLRVIEKLANFRSQLLSVENHIQI